MLGDLPLNFLIVFVHQVLLPPDRALTGYVSIDLNSKDYGGFARAGPEQAKAGRMPGKDRSTCSRGTPTMGRGIASEICGKSPEMDLRRPPVVETAEARRHPLRHFVRAHWRPHPAEAAGLQLQRGRMGWVQRAVRYRGRDRCGDDRLSPRRRQWGGAEQVLDLPIACRPRDRASWDDEHGRFSDGVDLSFRASSET